MKIMMMGLILSSALAVAAATNEKEEFPVKVAQPAYYGSIIFFGVVTNVLGYRLLKLTLALAALIVGGSVMYAATVLWHNNSSSAIVQSKFLRSMLMFYFFIVCDSRGNRGRRCSLGDLRVVLSPRRYLCPWLSRGDALGSSIDHLLSVQPRSMASRPYRNRSHDRWSVARRARDPPLSTSGAHSRFRLVWRRVDDSWNWSFCRVVSHSRRFAVSIR